jgi:2-dehydropantoate 2-reductase
MRVIVVGAGGVGCWLAGVLVLGGAEVTLVVRPKSAATLAGTGLALEAPPRRAHVRPAVRASVAEGRPADHDIAVVAVKSYDTAQVAAELAAAGSSPRVVSVQNGVGNEALLATVLRDSRVVAATLTTEVELERPGIVRVRRRGGIGLEQPPGDERVPELGAALVQGGETVRYYRDGAAMKWSKLLLNLLGVATAAALRWPPARALDDRRLFAVEHAAWMEGLAVMAALGLAPLDLPGHRVSLFARVARVVPGPLLARVVPAIVSGARSGRLPGVVQDVAAGRARSEIEVLNGAVVAAGSATHTPVPVNRALTALVTDLAAGRRARADFVGRPEAVLAYLARHAGLPAGAAGVGANS